MLNTTLYGIACVPAILGIVQVAKQSGMTSHLAPLLALLLGIAAGIGQAATGHLQLADAIAEGCALGLSASGLYSGAQAVTAGGQKEETPAPIAAPAAPPPATTTTSIPAQNTISRGQVVAGGTTPTTPPPKAKRIRKATPAPPATPPTT